MKATHRTAQEKYFCIDKSVSVVYNDVHYKTYRLNMFYEHSMKHSAWEEFSCQRSIAALQN